MSIRLHASTRFRSSFREKTLPTLNCINYLHIRRFGAEAPHEKRRSLVKGHSRPEFLRPTCDRGFDMILARFYFCNFRFKARYCIFLHTYVLRTLRSRYLELYANAQIYYGHAQGRTRSFPDIVPRFVTL